MTNLIQFFIRRRVWILGALVLLTGGFGAIASQAVFASSFVTLFLGEDPEYPIYRERIREFANDELFIVAFEDPKLLSQNSLRRLSQAVRRIKKIPEVGRVDSLLNAQWIHDKAGALAVEQYGDLARKQPHRAGEILEQLKSDPLYQGLLLSPDGRHAAVIVELEPKDDRPAERGPIVVRKVLDVFEQVGFSRARLHRVGVLATISEVVTQTQFNVTRLFPIVCVVLLAVLYLMFYRFWPVFITMAVSFIAVIWTAGFHVLLDKNINILGAMSPSVILIVATSDIIHLCSAYMLELARGQPKHLAILKSSREVGTACLMTSATTFVGFVSMALVPIPAFRLLGMVLGFGVAFSLLLAITLTPILFSLMPTPKPWSDESSRVQGLLTATLGRIEQLSLRSPWAMVIAFAMILGLSGLGLSRLNIETDFAKRLDAGNPVRIDQKYYRQHFVGTNFLELFIQVPEKDGLLDPKVFKQVSRFQKELQKRSEVDKVVSLVDLIETIHRVMNSEGSQAGSISMSRELLAQYLLMFEMSGGEDLNRLIDFDRKTMRLAVRLKDSAIRATYETGQKIRNMASTLLTADIQLQPSGLTYLFGGFLDEIINGQRLGLLFAFVTIMFMMMIWMRSLRVGLLSMIPNMIPLLALGGLVGMTWHQVDSDIIAIAMIAIGIGVDDTIHFLMRLKFESHRTNDMTLALQRTFHFSGRAIIITTTILALGFAPFAISDYLSIHIIGTLIPFTLAIALLADIFLVPALARLGMIRFRTPGTPTVPD